MVLKTMRYFAVLSVLMVSYTFMCVSEGKACETKKLQLSGNLDSASSVASEIGSTFAELEANSQGSISFEVYDSMGQSHVVHLYFFHGGSNAWSVRPFVDGADVVSGTSGMPAPASGNLSITMRFDLNGEAMPTEGNTRFYGAMEFVWSNGANESRLIVDMNDVSQLRQETELLVEAKDGGGNGPCPKYGVNDFDGDGTDDVAIWRPDSGYWAIRPSATVPRGLIWKQWGLSGDIPMPGDYTGDGRADLAVWRPSNGTWYVCPSDDNFTCLSPMVSQLGLPGDIPIRADYDGDGIMDFTVWRPTNGTFYYRSSWYGNVEIYSDSWGLPGDIPLVGGVSD